MTAKTSYKLRYLLVTLSVIGALLAAMSGNNFVKADQFDDQIKSLQQQNAANQSQSDQLAAQASNYQDAINKLQSQISGLQQNILDNQQKSDDLQNKINAEEAELAHQKQVLGETIKTMYLDGQVSTLEILASSKDLSEFVNKQQYRNSVQNKVKSTMDKINQLKFQLVAQKTQVEQLIKAEETEKAQLANAQAQQAQMLAYTEGQKAVYDQQTKANRAKISELRNQQAAAIAAASRRLGVVPVSGSGNGGYPGVWANASPDSMIDSWGMYNRECVSYTAYRVAASGRFMPYWGGVGNANQWPSDAINAGIPTGSTPRVGSVAIMYIGPYGHAMYVEAVNGDGTITVSQYNWVPYTFSMMKLSSAGLTYLYF